MTRRRFAHQAPKHAALSLADRLGADRLPLELALSLAVEVVEAAATAHQQRRAFGPLAASELLVQADGSIAITATPSPGAQPSIDTFSVGAVLYQLFTGVTPNQARARLAVSPLHAVPLASSINPALDESLEQLLALMLDQDPARRPHSLRVVEALLAEACDSFELEPSRAAVAAWAATKPAPSLVAAPPPAKVAVKRHVPTFTLVRDEEAFVDDEDGQTEESAVADAGPLRFDPWAVAACAFTFVAFAMATNL